METDNLNLKDVRRELRRAVKRWAVKEEGSDLFLPLDRQSFQTLESIVSQVRSEYGRLRKEFVVSLARRYITEQRRHKRKRSSLLASAQPPLAGAHPSLAGAVSAPSQGSFLEKLNVLKEREESEVPSSTGVALAAPGKSKGSTKENDIAEKRKNFFARNINIDVRHRPSLGVSR